MSNECIVIYPGEPKRLGSAPKSWSRLDLPVPPVKFAARCSELLKEGVMQREGLILGALIQNDGSHPAAWRHPDALPNKVANFKEKARLAHIAEAAKLDFLFFADVLGVQEQNLDVLPTVSGSSTLEPTMLVAALAAVTNEIGLLATASTSYNTPFNLARRFATLDHLSDGRAGWNVVTSTRDFEARNFGHEKNLEHDQRYQRAREFVEIVFRLWETWGEDAFPRDKASGIYADLSKMAAVDFVGSHLSIHGALNIEHMPQGRPVIAQAGASGSGRDFAAMIADVIFASKSDMASAQVYYAEMKALVSAQGRDPASFKILPGIIPFVAETDEEAQSDADCLLSLVSLDVALSGLEWILGVDVRKFPLDKGLPDLPITNASQSNQQKTVELARREGLTIRQLAQRLAVGRQFWTVVGSAKTVADQMENWFRNEAGDGFVVLPPHLPKGLEGVSELLVPELQRRGLFQADFSGRTFRERLGLPCHQPSGAGSLPDDARQI